MSRDFSKGKIHKITNDYNDDVYVGSTCDTLGKRFSRHKIDMKQKKKKNYRLYKLMNEIGFKHFRIQIIIDYPCEDVYQLTQKEGEYIRLLGTLNKEWKVEHYKNGIKRTKTKLKKLIKNIMKQTKIKLKNIV
jgi:Uri superfamily endonuclease